MSYAEIRQDRPTESNDSHKAVDGKNSEPETSFAPKLCKNLHCPILNLPQEILAQIFLQGKWDLEFQEPWDKPAGSQQWLNVCGVCRQWRQVALDTPGLWCTFEMLPVDRAFEYLKRSKAVRLRLSVYPSKDQDRQDVADAIMSHIGRIQTLNLFAQDEASMFHFLRLNAKASAHNLEDLTMEAPVFSLVKDIFSRDMSSLRYLRLHNGSLSSELPPLPSLAHLCIIKRRWTMVTNQLHVSTLVESLRNNPNIETIHIHSVAIEPSPNYLPSTPATLPKLTSLYICSFGSGSVHAFDHIEYPRTARIRCECRTQDISPAEVSRLRRVCARFLVAPDLQIHSVAYDVGYRFSIDVRATPLGDSETQTIFHLSIPYSNQIDEECAQLCVALSVGETTEFLLHHLVDSTWSNLLQFFPRVRTLHLKPCGEEMLTSLLRQADKEHPPLARLEWLYLSLSCTDIQVIEGLSTTLKAIRDEREHLGIPLRGIKLIDCDLSPEALKELRRIAQLGESDNEGESEGDSNSEGGSNAESESE